MFGLFEAWLEEGACQHAGGDPALQPAEVAPVAGPVDFDVYGDPILHPAPAPAAAAAAIPADRGRPEGRRQSETAKLRIAAGRARSHARTTAKAAARADSLEFSTRVAQAGFATNVDAAGRVQARKVKNLVDDCEAAILIDESHGYTSDVFRAVHSHHRAQAIGCSRWYSDGRDSGVSSTWAVHVADDCTVKLRRPGEKVDAAPEREEHGHREADLEKRGKNIPTTAMNLTEHVVQIMPPETGTSYRGLFTITPAVPMAKGNWSTILHHWRRWTLENGLRPGGGIDPEETIDTRSDGSKYLWLCKDSLSANLVWEAEVLTAAVESKGTPGEFLAIGRNCSAHQCVLTVRPSMEQIPDFCGNLTRTGNLFQSSTFASKWLRLLQQESERVRWVEVFDLPPGVDAAIEQNRAVLVATRGALDMTEKDEQFLLTILNCVWKRNPGDDGAPLQHHHTPSCPCGGKERFRANCHRAYSLVAGQGCPTMLLYRWKNFEQASCWLFRALWFGLLLPNMLRRMYPASRKKLEVAQRQVERAARNGEVNHGAVQQVRGHKAAAYWCRADAIKRAAEAILMNTAGQHYLNILLLSESLSRSLLEEACATPSSADAAAYAQQQSDAFTDSVAKSMETVLRILDRSAAEDMQADLSSFCFSFNASCWNATPETLTRREKFEFCKRCCCSIGATFYRLGFRFQQPKYDLLSACCRPFHSQNLIDSTRVLWRCSVGMAG